MALAFDLLPEPMRPGIFDDLLKLLDERDGHLCTGFLGTPLWCDTLSRFGRTDLAYDLLLKETYPGWLFPVTLGATTMWERWNSWHPEQGFVETGMNSLNHYAYGAVGDWMYRHIAGIDLDLAEDVGPRLRLQPTADARLGKCEASLDSAVGRIESSWEIADGKAHFRVVVPEGVPAERVLSDGQTQPLEPGEHKWTATLDD
jgi:alpha-L-rhamnosidase